LTSARGQAHEIEGFGDPPLDLLCGDVVSAQPKGHVVVDVQMREQPIRLEDRVDVPPVRGEVGHILTVEPHHSLGRRLEAADHAQRGGLPTAGWAKHAEELAAADLQVQPVDGDYVAEALDHRFQHHHRIAIGCLSGGPPGRVGRVPGGVHLDEAALHRPILHPGGSRMGCENRWVLGRT